MPKLTPRTIAKLAAERRQVAAQLTELTKRKAELDARLLSVDLAQTYTGDGIMLSFTPVRTLDAGLIAAKFPAEKFPDFYKLSVDVGEFKKAFSENDRHAYEKVSHRINIKEV